MQTLVTYILGAVLILGITTLISVDHTLWQIIMIVTAVAALLASLLMVFLPEPVRGKQDGQEHNQFNWDDIKTLLASRNYAALLLVNMLTDIGTTFQSIWMTVFFADESGLGSLIPLIAGVPALLSILFIYPFGILVDRVQLKWPKNGRLKVVLVGQVCCCIY